MQASTTSRLMRRNASYNRSVPTASNIVGIHARKHSRYFTPAPVFRITTVLSSLLKSSSAHSSTIFVGGNRAGDRIATWLGLPRRLRFDNGPDFTAIAVADWAEQNGVDLEFIRPGKPMQNGFIERFNRTYRPLDRRVRCRNSKSNYLDKRASP